MNVYYFYFLVILRIILYWFFNKYWAVNELILFYQATEIVYALICKHSLIISIYRRNAIENIYLHKTLIRTTFFLEVRPFVSPVHIYSSVSEHCREAKVWFNHVELLVSAIILAFTPLCSRMVGFGLPFTWQKRCNGVFSCTSTSW